MDFCIISPTAGLEKYAVLSKTHLVLAHINQREYIDFYKNRRVAGDLLILDNGAYEGMSLPMENLRACIDWYNPQVVALPDFLLQPWKKTWHAGIHFLDMHYERYPDTQWLYIPQAEKGDMHGFIESYQEAVTDERITWIGIPRALAYAISDNPLMRVEFARMVRRDHPRIKLHAFGMVNGDIHEIPYLRAAGVTSIDSSAPVWRGWMCNRIDDKYDRALWDKQGIPVDFNRTEPLDGWDKTCCSIIKHNLEACGISTRE